MSELVATKPALAESGTRWLWIGGVVLVLDQWTKHWVITNFYEKEQLYLLSVLRFERRHNPGAAFSWGAEWGDWSRWGFSILGIVVSIAIVIALTRIRLATQRILTLGLCLIVGGAMGNVIDRVRLGQVTDFIVAHWGDAQFPAFNVADAAITVGAVLVIIDALMESRRKPA